MWLSEFREIRVVMIGLLECLPKMLSSRVPLKKRTLEYRQGGGFSFLRTASSNKNSGGIVVLFLAILQQDNS